MKIKTEKLAGAALDWAVSKSEGFSVYIEGGACHTNVSAGGSDPYTPSIDWDQGGPILEREKFDTAYLSRQAEWYAYRRNRSVDDHVIDAGFGPTLLIAAMRCYVASKLGEEVDVPDELAGDQQ
jgi:hypothetical protein